MTPGRRRDPGPYTAIIRGNDATSGVALVEAYDVDQAGVPTKLANISTRAFVSTGSDIVIAGFILGGSGSDDSIIVRGIGPSLTQFGVPDALANPTLELRNSSGTLIRSNDNWMDDPTGTCAAIMVGAGLAPTDPLESAICATLPPGQYTALLAGQNNGTGVGLIEVYDHAVP
jgi:hypothetical protein